VFSPVGRDRLYEEVVHQITPLILNGHLKPGDRLPSEDELAQQFNVSRTVVRESVRFLIAHGLVEVTPGRGTFVTTPSLETAIQNMRLVLRVEIASLDDLVDTRRILEVPVARLAAMNATTASIDALSCYLDLMRSSMETPEDFVRHDTEFHHELARAAHNPILLILVQPIIMTMGVYRDAVSRVPDMVSRALQMHQGILQAVIEKDGNAAAQAMHNHIDQISEDIARARAIGMLERKSQIIS
jgi:GntR family transcriptional repressor for pyruvate dehydrogenase complex